MISEKILQEVQERLDIVEVVGSYLPLKKSGQNFKALCPFHPEKTPSFMVYPQKQFYICYGCGVGGDLISFIMRHEHCEFSEAVHLLAEKAGVKIPTASSKREKSLDPDLYRAHEVAWKFYRDSLAGSPAGELARSYLKRRGLEPAVWEMFGLGYAPSQWDGLLSVATKEGISPKLLEKAGLVIPREGSDAPGGVSGAASDSRSRAPGGVSGAASDSRSQGFYDRFRHRIMFPIWDGKGRVIGFGGRALEEEGSKYMNSPETDLYVKSRVLYGLHLAAPHIREKDFCIVVEGYMDLIQPYQQGVRNIVASMGTSLTESQVQLIRRMTHHVVIVYDGDYAGEMAALRGLDLFLDAQMRVKVAALPQGYDPDSLVRKKGLEALTKCLQESQDLFDYKLGLLKRQWNPKEMEGRVQICAEMLPTIKRVPNAIERGEYIKKLSQFLNVDEALLWTELKGVKLDSSSWKPTVVATPSVQAVMTAEDFLAGLLLEEPARIKEVAPRLQLENVKDGDVHRLVSFLLTQCEKGNIPTDHRELIRILASESKQMEARAARWLALADTIAEKDRTLLEVLQKIEKNQWHNSAQNLKALIRQAEEAGNETLTTQLIVELNHLMKSRTVKCEVV